jgi:hypothetical protein
MKRVPTEEILSLFAPVDGTINFYYGRIGSGKTYAATSDILDLLNHGEVVYANWKIDWAGYDQRQDFWNIFYKALFLKNLFFRYPKENFHYFDPDEQFKTEEECIEFLGKLANAYIFIDEGQWIFSSQDKLTTIRKKLILHTRHYNRQLSIISQRTQAIRVDARGNVNRFFKCESGRRFYIFPCFRRTEYQEMRGDDVADGELDEPVDVKVYFPRKKVFRAYSTLAMRGADALPQIPQFEAYKVSFLERPFLLVKSLFSRSAGREKTLNSDTKVEDQATESARSGLPEKVETPRLEAPRRLVFLGRFGRDLNVSYYGKPWRVPLRDLVPLKGGEEAA